MRAGFERDKLKIFELTEGLKFKSNNQLIGSLKNRLLRENNALCVGCAYKEGINNHLITRLG